MTIAPWVLPSILSVFLWGISMFLPSLAIKRLPPFHMTIYSYSFFLLGSIILQGFYEFHVGFDMRGSALAAAVGIVGGIAQILYNVSLKSSSMTYSVVVTSLYPVVATLLAYFILGEDLTLRQTAGIILVILSLILMVKASDSKIKN
jgi:drug/metabolite transporter (DMT)-like permease